MVNHVLVRVLCGCFGCLPESVSSWCFLTRFWALPSSLLSAIASALCEVPEGLPLLENCLFGSDQMAGSAPFNCAWGFQCGGVEF